MEPRRPLFRPSEPPGARRSVLSDYMPPREQHRDRYWLHVVLFLLTLISTTFTVGQFIGRDLVWAQAEPLFSLLGFPVTWPFLADGLRFAAALLGFLTVHEFGHYFAARRHGVATSLPYYIPTPLIGVGTMGAVIRIRQPVPSLRTLFDIGAAGPLAGFVVAVGLLVYALATLPPPDYLLGMSGHESTVEYFRQNGVFPPDVQTIDPDFQGMVIVVGQTGLYWLLTQFFANVPPMYEMYHYPVLFAGWLGLFFTALNLLPVGQLDGGHILYALVGRTWHRRLARGFVVLLLISMAIGFATEGIGWVTGWLTFLSERPLLGEAVAWMLLAALLYVMLRRVFQDDWRVVVPVVLGIVLIAALAKVAGPVLTQFGYVWWLPWALILVFFIRVDHPPVLYTEPLTPARRALGIVSVIIFFLCFSFAPLRAEVVM